MKDTCLCCGEELDFDPDVEYFKYKCSKCEAEFEMSERPNGSFVIIGCGLKIGGC